MTRMPNEIKRLFIVSGETSHVQTLKLSIVIPTFGRARQLCELLHSLSVQTIKPKEIVVVDDTPNNSVRDIALVWVDKLPIKYIYSGRKSLPAARNLGIKVTDGDYVLFLDSDTLLHPRFIENLLNGILRHPKATGFTGYDITTTANNILRRSLKHLFFMTNVCPMEQISEPTPPYTYPCSPNRDVSVSWLPGACMAYSRKVFNARFNFDERLTGYAAGEDLLFSHKLYLAGHKLFLIHNAYYVHLHDRENRPRLRQYLPQLSYVYNKLWGSRGLYKFLVKSFGVALLNIYALLNQTLDMHENQSVRAHKYTNSQRSCWNAKWEKGGGPWVSLQARHRRHAKRPLNKNH